MLIVGGCLIQSFRIRLQQRRHLVNKRACTTGTDAIHSFLQTTPKIDDLRILASQLDCHICLGCNRLQSRGYRYHLLDKPDAQGLSQVNSTGAGSLDTQLTIPQAFLCLLKQLGHHIQSMGMVPAVLSKYKVLPGIQNHKLHRGGAHINTGKIDFFHAFLLFLSISIGP